MSDGEISPWIPFGSQNKNTDSCIVAFHHAGGSAAFFRDWLDHPALRLIDVFPVELPGRGRRIMEPGLKSIASLHQNFFGTLEQIVQPYRNIVLFGHSLGALVAYEAAHYLEACGKESISVFASARRAPQLATPGPWRHLMADRELMHELRRLGGTQEELLQSQEMMELILPTIRSDFAMTETYLRTYSQPISSPLICLRGVDDAEVSEEDMSHWQGVAGTGFDIKAFPGGHFYISEPQNLSTVLQKIKSSFD